MKSIVAIATIIFFASFNAIVSAAPCPTNEINSIATSPDGSECTKKTGYSFVTLNYPTNEQLAGMCTTPACQRVIQRLNALLPPGCSSDQTHPIRESLIVPLMTECFPPQCGNEQVGPQSCPNGQYCQPWNPSYYQCRRIEAKCGRQEIGIDFYGNDLGKFQLLLPEDCCNKCTGTIGCRAYTFVNYNPDGKAYCYLKTGTGTRTAAKGVVSAEVGRAGTRCPDPMPDVDLFGDDLHKVTGVPLAECCEKCLANSNCKAWTYAISDSTCYLKSGVGLWRPVKGLVSAFKRR